MLSFPYAMKNGRSLKSIIMGSPFCPGLGGGPAFGLGSGPVGSAWGLFEVVDQQELLEEFQVVEVRALGRLQKSSIQQDKLLAPAAPDFHSYICDAYNRSVRRLDLYLLDHKEFRVLDRKGVGMLDVCSKRCGFSKYGPVVPSCTEVT